MTRRMYLFAGAMALVVACIFANSGSTAPVDGLAGKWVHRGPRGVSVLEFFPGEKRLLGPTKGVFRHAIFLDDGRVIEGEGHYQFRSFLPNRGWLTLHFADGFVTQEHEHALDGTTLKVKHHGVTRTYVRQ